MTQNEFHHVYGPVPSKRLGAPWGLTLCHSKRVPMTVSTANWERLRTKQLRGKFMRRSKMFLRNWRAN
jgi:hypothetical protein